jgi:ribose 5-phosphate isomerase B
MKIAAGCDHAGYELKVQLIAWLKAEGHEIADVGTHSQEAADYPDFARAVGAEVANRRCERGLVVCGSGVGACVAANKMKGVRAGVCHDTFSARQGVEDDDMNTLCLGARIIGIELAKDVLRSFLAAKFSKLDRHVRRLNKVLDIEKQGH